MKRHNFKGQGASHGNHKKHRSPGSVGACATPARVFKGMRMAGQMGNERVTTLNLEVVEGDAERDLLLVQGRGARSGRRPGVRPRRREGEAVRPSGCAGPTAIDVRTTAGATNGSATWSGAVFGIEPNVPVMHQVVTAQLAAARRGTHTTHTRGEVRGGGAKPWQAEGHRPRPPGLRTAPHWRGGGVAHGPKPPRLQPAHAPQDGAPGAPLRAVRPGRRGQGRRGRPGASTSPRPRTPSRRSPRSASSEGRVLSCWARTTTSPSGRSATCSSVQVVHARELNTYDILVNDWLVFTTETLARRQRPAGASSAGGDALRSAAPAAEEPAAGDVEDADDGRRRRRSPP